MWHPEKIYNGDQSHSKLQLLDGINEENLLKIWPINWDLR
jgi:hypothetical protein